MLISTQDRGLNNTKYMWGEELTGKGKEDVTTNLLSHRDQHTQSIPHSFLLKNNLKKRYLLKENKIPEMLVKCL